MPAISINSLIANLSPGRVPSPGPLPGRVPDTPVQDQGVVFTRSEPWRNQTGTRVGYSRQDVRGGVRGDAAPPSTGQEVPPDPAAEQGASSPDQGEASKPQAATEAAKKPNGETLSQAEAELLRELQQADVAVRAHEMAHLAAAGGYARGGASFSYRRGPDGQNYAVGGEVQIDTGKENTPEATIVKMQIIRQAALAPVDPSPQDQRVAAHATLQIAEASKELLLAQSSGSREEATPRGPIAEEGAAAGAGTTRGVYRQAGADLTGGVSPPPVRSQKGYAAYRSSSPPPPDPGRQGLDRTA